MNNKKARRPPAQPRNGQMQPRPRNDEMQMQPRPRHDVMHDQTRPLHRARAEDPQMEPRVMSSNREGSIPRHIQRFLDNSSLSTDQRHNVRDVYTDISRLADIERHLDEINIALDLKKNHPEEHNVNVLQKWLNKKTGTDSFRTRWVTEKAQKVKPEETCNI